jgi:hypothetical protein
MHITIIETLQLILSPHNLMHGLQLVILCNINLLNAVWLGQYKKTPLHLVILVAPVGAP